MKSVNLAAMVAALSLLASCGNSPPDVQSSTRSLLVCPPNCECDDEGLIISCIDPIDLFEKFGQILAEIIMDAFPDDPPPPQSNVTYMSVGCNFQKSFSGQDYQGTEAYSETTSFSFDLNAPTGAINQNTDYGNWECAQNRCYPPAAGRSAGQSVNCSPQYESICATQAATLYNSPTNPTCGSHLGFLNPNFDYGNNELASPNQSCNTVRNAGRPFCPTNWLTCAGTHTVQHAATLTPAGAEQKCLDEKISGPYGAGLVSPVSCSCNCTTPDPTTHQFACTCTGEFIFEYNGPTPNDESTEACVIDAQCGSDTGETCSCAATSDGQNYYMCP